MKKKIALIAHDNCKQTLLDWAVKNADILAQHELYATGTTGKLLQSALVQNITLFKSGPLGGDLQVGAAIVNGDVNCVVFFWDPLEPHPHDVDVKALLRIAVVHDVPIACNRSSAELMIKSPLMDKNLQNEPINKMICGESADKIGLSDVMDEFLEENAALVERYQAGFESILGVLAERVAKKLKDKHDIEIIKEVLEETLKKNVKTELDNAQKHKVHTLLRQMYTLEEFGNLLDDFLLGNKDCIDTISERINKVEWQLSKDGVAKFLDEYFESNREAREKYKAAVAEEKARREEVATSEVVEEQEECSSGA